MKDQDVHSMSENQLYELLQEMDILFEEFEQMSQEEQAELLVKAMLLLDEKGLPFIEEEDFEERDSFLD